MVNQVLQVDINKELRQLNFDQEPAINNTDGGDTLAVWSVRLLVEIEGMIRAIFTIVGDM